MHHSRYLEATVETKFLDIINEKRTASFLDLGFAREQAQLDEVSVARDPSLNRYW